MPENIQESVPPPAPPPPRPRKGGGAKIMLVVLIVLGLAGVIVYLLSLLNSKKFFLVPEAGELVVKKGIFFPVGSERYQPKDPVDASVYRPIDLPDELKHAGPIEFEDLPSLNHEFGNHMIKFASKLVVSKEPKKYRKGREYLKRLSNIKGLDANQLQSIQGMNADVDYIEAKMAYLGVEQTLEQALKKFRQAEMFGTGQFPDAAEWIQKIEVLLEAIRVTKAGGTVTTAEKPKEPAEVVVEPVPPKPKPRAHHPRPKPKTAPEDEPEPNWQPKKEAPRDGI